MCKNMKPWRDHLRQCCKYFQKRNTFLIWTVQKESFKHFLSSPLLLPSLHPFSSPLPSLLCSFSFSCGPALSSDIKGCCGEQRKSWVITSWVNVLLTWAQPGHGPKASDPRENGQISFPQQWGTQKWQTLSLVHMRMLTVYAGNVYHSYLPRLPSRIFSAWRLFGSYRD